MTLAALAFLAGCSNPQSMQDETVDTIDYPETRKTDVRDDYFGTTVDDPYRWLEDDTAAETEAWVKAQNATTQKYLARISYRDQIEKRLTQLFNYPRLSSPRRVGDYYFFYKNSGLQNQSVIYYQEGREGEPKVFIDPNTLSESGTISINLLGHSPDHKYIAYSQSEGGSDWSEIRIREVASNKELDDRLEWVKFSGTEWVGDGFYYSRYPEPEAGTELSGDNKFHSVYFHRVGTPQSEDQLFYRNDDAPNLYHFVSVTEDKQYLSLSAASGTDGFETYIKNLAKNGKLTRMTRGFANKTSIVDHHDGRLLALTDIGAPNYRLVSIDPNNFDQGQWKDVIPESDQTLVGVSTAGGYLFAHYLENATSQVRQYEYSGDLVRKVEFPAPGSVGGFSGEKDDSTVFYTFYSFTYPPTIFEYDIATGESKIFNKTELQFDPEEYTSEQVWYTSKDGTEIPMFLVYRKGMEKNGDNPTMLYGYGGFNISITPSFSTSNIVFLENGGIYAVANLRGGGEFGEEWHQQGMKEKKQNVFDDFIAAAEYLIDQGYTSPERLAIKGRSNGGLLVGAAMTQRPNLFAVALPGVGVMDMLRYQKFTVGKGWVPEFGSADSSKTEFDYLYAYSPLHNLKEGVEYPSTFITTGDHDDRVVPAHSFKFAATLQEDHAGDEPVLIRIETDAGHGAGKPIAKIIAEQADEWAFAMYQLGMDSLPGTPSVEDMQ